MAGKKHTHKYYKMKLSGVTEVWACAHDDCTHYLPKHLEDMINGKGSICWDCGNTMKMNPNQVEMNKPTCDDCNGSGEINLSPSILEYLKNKGVS